MNELVTKARDYANEKHGDQKYGICPYLRHLDDVAVIVASHGEEAMAIAYLHDVLEDVKGATAEDLEKLFGQKITGCVKICTDEPGKSRPERKQKTNAKMSAVKGDLEIALVVKAADRLANVRESVRASILEPGNKQLPKYKGEYPEFRLAAHRPGLCDEIWDELDRLLS